MNKTLKRHIKKHIFCWSFLIVPLIQFFIFFVVVNYNQIIMAFQKFTLDASGKSNYIFLDDPFGNFKEVFYKLSNNFQLKKSFGNSLIAFACNLIFGMSFTLIFSSYIYHKRIFSSYFKIMLFLPNIVSTVVFASIFKSMDNRVLPYLFGTPKNLLTASADTDAQFVMLVCFGMFMGMGTQILSYSGAMSGISESLVEAATLDGVNIVQEFFYITVPMIWPTFTTFITVSVAGFFNQQLSLFNFFDVNANDKLYTYGYYLFVQTKKAISDHSMLPELSAMGLIFTTIITPLVFFVRYMLRKFGPSVD